MRSSLLRFKWIALLEELFYYAAICQHAFKIWMGYSMAQSNCGHVTRHLTVLYVFILSISVFNTKSNSGEYWGSLLRLLFHSERSMQKRIGCD